MKGILYKIWLAQLIPCILGVLGPSTLSFPTNTRISHRVLGLSTKYSTLMLMNRMIEFIHSSSGSVCLDVINQLWSPMYDLINVFDVFIPQLLQYPNPSDPLNPEAASLMMKEKPKYRCWLNKKIRKKSKRHGSKVCD